MFVDRAAIKVIAGSGGNGRVSFRREKYVPEGGPNGGDGGKGGSIIARVDTGLHTLIDFRYQRVYKAANGGSGDIKNMSGRSGEDLVLRVPAGTLFLDAATKLPIADLTEPGQEAVLARGGRGGRGNARFTSSTNQAPEVAENGAPGESRDLILELKMLASVGLVGYPNAGKSTLLTALTAARPKIADYPFTTLTPNLGVVQADEENSYVMADIPGLIEGAHTGIGLGHDFLRHIERTKLLVHLIDLAAVDGRDPISDYLAICRELTLYSEELGKRKQIIVLNKIDLPAAAEHMPEVLAWFQAREITCFPISALTREGFAPLLKEITLQLSLIPDLPPLTFTSTAELIFADESAIEIQRESEDLWVVKSKRLERHVLMTDFTHNASVKRFQGLMRKIGVDEMLRQAGAMAGHTVRIGEMEFIFADYDDEEEYLY
ncbi:MAG: GTPase ObgE [Negativicutes bacterium]|nr:GTPase ObgE [Negativicutes bacterium]